MKNYGCAHSKIYQSNVQEQYKGSKSDKVCSRCANASFIERKRVSF